MTTRVDIGAVGRAEFARLQELTHPQAAEIIDLRVAGVSAKRIATLYPFTLAEHLPQAAAHALTGVHAGACTDALDTAEILSAYRLFVEHPKLAGSHLTLGAMIAVNQTVNVAALHAVGLQHPDRKSSLPVRMTRNLHAWAYLLIFFEQLAKFDACLVPARGKLATTLRQQRETARLLADILSA